MEAVASEAQSKPIKFSEIVKDLVITPLGLKRTFMFDEMEYDAKLNKVAVKGASEIKVAQGYDYCDGKVTSGQDFNYDEAAGGIYSNAQEVSKFYQTMLSEKPFDEVAAQSFPDPRNFIPSDLHAYGLGIRKMEHEGVEYYHHGGAGLGFYSHVIGQRNIASGDIKVATTLISYENLTRPIAAALLGDEKKDAKGNFFIDEELSEKMHELTRHYNQQQLIEMRKDLDLLPKNFQERSKVFKEISAEKYSAKAPPSSLRPAEATQQLQSIENVRTE